MTRPSRGALAPLLLRLPTSLAPALLAAMILATPGPAAAAPKQVHPAGHRVLLVVQQPPQLDAALMTAEQMLRGQGFKADEVEVIACGKAVGPLLAKSQAPAKLQAAQRAGARVTVCGLSLHKLGLQKDAVRPGVPVVENGLVETVRREAEGWLAVVL